MFEKVHRLVLFFQTKNTQNQNILIKNKVHLSYLILLHFFDCIAFLNI